MKIQRLLALVCSAILLGLCAAARAAEPPVVALRFAAAADAFVAIQQTLGAKVAEAVSGVDERRNTIALISDHPQAAIVRAFLTDLDHPTKGTR